MTEAMIVLLFTVASASLLYLAEHFGEVFAWLWVGGYAVVLLLTCYIAIGNKE